MKSPISVPAERRIGTPFFDFHWVISSAADAIESTEVV
jgi:hypothetical protein